MQAIRKLFILLGPLPPSFLPPSTPSNLFPSFLLHPPPPSFLPSILSSNCRDSPMLEEGRLALSSAKRHSLRRGRRYDRSLCPMRAEVVYHVARLSMIGQAGTSRGQAAPEPKHIRKPLSANRPRQVQSPRQKQDLSIRDTKINIRMRVAPD